MTKFQLRIEVQLALVCVVLAACSSDTGSKTGEPGAEQPKKPVAAFLESAAATGLEFSYFNGMTGEFFLPEVTAGGVAVIDFDGDGDLDVFLPQGAMLQPGRSSTDALVPLNDGDFRDRLYENQLVEEGRLRFVDVSGGSGLEGQVKITGALQPSYGMGAAVGDFDGDGWPDLYVTNLRANLLYRNLGDGTFEDVTEVAGVGGRHWSVAALFFDYNRDGHLDLYVGNYVAFDPDDPKRCFRVTGSQDYCGPMAYRESPDVLYRNRGDGTFEDVTVASGLANAFGSGLGAAALDLDSDGWLDLFVANDGRPNQLWLNQRDGTFSEEGLLRGGAVNADGLAEASMGVVAADFDGDLDEDVLLAHLLGETNTLLRADQGLFTDDTISSGMGSSSKWATSFGLVAFDLENDGDLDVFAANGQVRVVEEQVSSGEVMPLKQANQLFVQEAGRFADDSQRGGEAVTAERVSRGVAAGDLDNDGDTDLLVVNVNQPLDLLVNQAGDGSLWVGVDLRGGSSAAGAEVLLTMIDGSKLYRRCASWGSYASSSDSRVLFGLGAAGETRTAERSAVRDALVRWQDGSVEQFVGLQLGQYQALERGTGIPSEWNR